MNKQPLVILVAFFILGIFFQDRFSLNVNYIYPIIGICLFVCIATFFRNYFLHLAKPYLLCTMFFGIGIVLHFFNSSHKQPTVSGNKTIVFKICGKLNSNEKNRKYEAVVQTQKDIFKAVLYLSLIHISEPTRPY